MLDCQLVEKSVYPQTAGTTVCAVPPDDLPLASRVSSFSIERGAQQQKNFAHLIPMLRSTWSALNQLIFYIS